VKLDPEELDTLAAQVAVHLRPMIEALATTRAPLLLLARRERYARRVGFSVRALDGLLTRECYAGEGRQKRVIVAIADRVLLARLGAAPASAEPESTADNVIALARATARRAR
jgi:hypothetical protein